MDTNIPRRGLDRKFIQDLKTGILQPLLGYVRKDPQVILEIRDIGGGREAKPSGAQDLQTGTKPSAAGTRGKSPGQGLRRETGPVRPNGRRNPGVGTSDTPTHPRSRLPSDTLRTLRNPSE